MGTATRAGKAVAASSASGAAAARRSRHPPMQTRLIAPRLPAPGCVCSAFCLDGIEMVRAGALHAARTRAPRAHLHASPTAADCSQLTPLPRTPTPASIHSCAPPARRAPVRRPRASRPAPGPASGGSAAPAPTKTSTASTASTSACRVGAGAHLCRGETNQQQQQRRQRRQILCAPNAVGT